jgi:hypothetical protein
LVHDGTVRGGVSRGLWVLLCVCAAIFWSPRASAHAASDGYLTLTFGGPDIDARWDLALRDLDDALTLDRGHAMTLDARLSEVRGRKAEIMAFALGHLVIQADGEVCPLAPGGLDFTEHGGSGYVTLDFRARCPAVPREVALDYELFFDRDPLHRGLTRIDDGADSRSILFSSGFRKDQFTRNVPGHSHALAGALVSGIGHIASGVDHLLFLLALLLPAVLRREGSSWQPVGSFREAAIEVAKIVTAFTLAHSVTLSLSVLDVVRLSPRFVEPAIAASIVVAALQNVVRPSGHGRWKVALALGLLHGFGFSAALLDLGLRGRDLAVTLFGFNLGVEIGQLVVVAVFLPLAFRLRSWPRYPTVVVRNGSLVIAIVASVWFVQRAFPSAASRASGCAVAE